jgi:hypothetical protein
MLLPKYSLQRKKPFLQCFVHNIILIPLLRHTMVCETLCSGGLGISPQLGNFYSRCQPGISALYLFVCCAVKLIKFNIKAVVSNIKNGTCTYIIYSTVVEFREVCSDH